MMNPEKMKSATARTGKRGFTLVELMIAVAIIGIIAAVAYPSYVQYVLRGNQAAAQAHLSDIVQQEQQYIVDNRAYTATLADLNGLTTPTSVSKYYTITIAVTAGPPPTFVATATPKAGTAQASEPVLTINNVGTKTPPEKW